MADVCSPVRLRWFAAAIAVPAHLNTFCAVPLPVRLRALRRVAFGAIVATANWFEKSSGW